MTVEEAEAERKAFTQEAEETLSELGSTHDFEMSGECEDKSGELTSVFTVDTDREGILGMFIKHGQPVTVGSGGEMKINDDKIALYFSFMANVDISKDANQRAVGMSALAKGRELVSTFFTLRLASDMFSA